MDRAGIELVMLIGAPGSGKSWAGEALAKHCGCRFIDGERMLLEKYGSTTNFVRQKEEALTWFEARVREALDEHRGTVIVESTGHTQRPMLDRLMRAYTTLRVLVDAPKELCIRRAAGREPGTHFTDDIGFTERFYSFFYESIVPRTTFDLVVRNEDTTKEEFTGRFLSELARLDVRLASQLGTS